MKTSTTLSQQNFDFAVKEISALKPRGTGGNANTFYDEEGGFLILAIRSSEVLDLSSALDGLEKIALELIELQENKDRAHRVYNDTRMN